MHELEHVIQRMSTPLINIRSSNYLGPYLIWRRWNSYLAELCLSASILSCLLPPTRSCLQGLSASNSELQQAWEAIIMRSDNDSNDKKINARKRCLGRQDQSGGRLSPPLIVTAAFWRVVTEQLRFPGGLCWSSWMIGEAVHHTARCSVSGKQSGSIDVLPAGKSLCYAQYLLLSDQWADNKHAWPQAACYFTTLCLFPQGNNMSYYRCSAGILSSVS